MHSFELYLFKSIIALSMLFGFYLLFLRNETSYSKNRHYLLLTIIISALFPILNISFADYPNHRIANIIEPIIVGNVGSEYYNGNTSQHISILSIIYISGAVFFSLRFLFNLAKIGNLYFGNPKFNYCGFKTIVLNRDFSLFTFFNVLFISAKDFEAGLTNEMIVHEQTHRKQYHSVDLILLELITILQWINPFVWFLRTALVAEQEFIADSKVLKDGFDLVNYQKLLLSKSLGGNLALTNGFNYSLLKKRLIMMTVKESSTTAKIKYWFTIPLIMSTIILSTFNLKTFAQNDKVYTEVDVKAKYKDGDEDGLRSFIAKNLRYPESAAKNNLKAKIYVQFVVDENGKVTNVEVVSTEMKNLLGEIVVVAYKPADDKQKLDKSSKEDLEAEAIRAVKLLSDFTPAQKDGKNVKCYITIPIIFTLQ